MKQILVTLPMPPEQRALLEQQMPGAAYIYCPKNEVTDEQIAAASIILGNLPPERLAGAKKLEWLQLNSSGADAYAKPGVLPAGAKLTNATGAYGLAISEQLLGYTFFLKKKFGLYYKNQLAGVWKDEGLVTAVAGSTTLVVGLGSIGGDYAAKMAALGSRVYGIRRNKTDCPPYLAAVGSFEQLDEWLPQADIVALALPNTPETVRLFDETRLAKMKPGSILLNVGRGSCVDHEALAAALRAGPLAAAALDVTEPEPLPAGHPLWKSENLFLTPHVAGDFHLQETLDWITALFIENLGRYARGEALQNPVDPATGYRQFCRQP